MDRVQLQGPDRVSTCGAARDRACLLYAQLGGKHADTQPLKGFGGAGVLEIIERTETATYRAVYTVRLAGQVYVLHAFQKKSKKGIATPKHELDLIKARLKVARELHRQLENKGGT